MSNKVIERIELLISMLTNTDSLMRQTMRVALISIGEPAVPQLITALQTSKSEIVRWEIAKALGVMLDERSIPALVASLNDASIDIAWLSAEALAKFKKRAWPTLLRALIKDGSKSILLRRGAHHVLRNQNDEEYNELLNTLRKVLEKETVPAGSFAVASKILAQMGEASE